MRLLGSAATAVLVALLAAVAAGFVLSAATQATLITFRTGSMAPAMPAGTLAVTVPISAAEIRPGDVITVRRAQQALPVTHRVLEVRRPPASAPPGSVEFILKGDDNDVPDSRPYVITGARKVVAAAPRVGNWLMLAQTPIALAALTLAAGALTTWAFWPRRRG